MNDQDSNYISLKEASQVLKTGEKTIRKWVRNGSLKAYKTPGKKLLFRPEDIKEMILRSVADGPAVDAFLAGLKRDE